MNATNVATVQPLQIRNEQRELTKSKMPCPTTRIPRSGIPTPSHNQGQQQKRKASPVKVVHFIAYKHQFGVFLFFVII